FGALDVAGFDYEARYEWRSSLGTWSPSANATETYRFTQSTLPGLAASNLVSQSNGGAYAVRWKGTLNLDWQLQHYSAGVHGRYISRYTDFTPLANGAPNALGDFWLVDFSARWSLNNSLLRHWKVQDSYLEFGVVNLLNRLPAFSPYFGLGYDPSQYDIRGRFVSINFGARL